MKRKVVVTAVALGCTLLGCDTGSNASDPSCSIGTELQQALADETAGPLALLACPQIVRVASGMPIPVDVALANLSDSTLSVEVQFAFGAYLDATIVSDSLGQLQPDGFVDVGLGSRVVLRPGEIHEQVVYLPCVYSTGGEWGQCVPRYDMSREGNYTVIFRYVYPSRDTLDPGRGQADVLFAPAFVVVVE